MARPRLDPERVLTSAERRDRSRQRQRQRLDAWRAALERIAEATRLDDARQAAVEALAAGD
jgi:hypothetical protein